MSLFNYNLLSDIQSIFEISSQYNNYMIILFQYLSIIFCISVILSNNAIVSIIYLILLYINVSIYLYFTGLGVIGLLYILVYVGAIAILFLFILSLINMKISELNIISNKQDILLILITTITLFYITYIVYIGQSSNNEILNLQTINNNSDNNIYLYNILYTNWNDINTYSEIKIIGELLYTEYSLIMLIVGIILLLAIIGVIVITGSNTKNNITGPR